MPTNHIYEEEILAAFTKGQIKSIATKSELAKFKAVARAMANKDPRFNVTRSSVDLDAI